MSLKTYTPEQTMKAHQYIYYVLSNNVWSDYEYDQFCKRNGLDGNGGSDLASNYPPEVVELARAMLKNPQQYPPV